MKWDIICKLRGRFYANEVGISMHIEGAVLYKLRGGGFYANEVGVSMQIEGAVLCKLRGRFYAFLEACSMQI